MINTLVEKLQLIKLKQMLKQQQSRVKSPQMPLIQVGQVPIPNCLENQGLLCIGSSEERLNTSINLVRQMKQRTDFRGIILDRSGELIKRFFDPALDTIFAPNDDRSINWCHKAEPVSGKELARSLIDIDPADPFFDQAAIEVLAVIFESSATSDEVWQKLNVLMPQDLQTYLPDYNRLVAEMLQEPMRVYLSGDSRFVAEMLHEPDCAKTVMSIIKNVTQFYRYLKDISDFSFYDWGRNDDPGWIFIPWFDGNEDDSELMPLRQMTIDLALQGLLSQKGVHYHKSAVILPEVSCLKIKSLPQFVGECCHSLSKKFLFLGSENLSSTIEGCGQQNAQLFLEGMATKLLLNGWAQGLNQVQGQILIANNTPLSALQRNLPPGQGYLAIDDECVKVKI